MFTVGLNKEVKRNFELLWDFMCLDEVTDYSDYILCLGSLDKKVPAYASKIWNIRKAPFVIMSGGIAHQDDLAKTPWEKSEARVFADIAIANGVPYNKILIENKASNTAENFKLSEEIYYLETGEQSKRISVVCKPYMGRRARNTAKKIWNDKKVFVESYKCSFSDYINISDNPSVELELIVGDMHRIMVYPDLDFMVGDTVFEKVKQSFVALVDSGFDKHLVRNSTGYIFPWN